jgi:hypothetical protein
MRSEEPTSVYAEVESEALQLAGVTLDYTDAIVSPSTWAQPAQLEAIASLLGLDGTGRRQFLACPDDYLQRPVADSDDVALIDLPHVSHALDMAWQTYVALEMDRHTVRGKALAFRSCGCCICVKDAGHGYEFGTVSRPPNLIQGASRD